MSECIPYHRLLEIACLDKDNKGNQTPHSYQTELAQCLASSFTIMLKIVGSELQQDITVFPVSSPASSFNL